MTLQTNILATIETGAVTILSSEVSHLAVGDGTSTPLVSQTALDNETYRDAIFNTATTANTYTTSLYLDVTEANGSSIAEIGAFDSSSGATMISRNLTNVAAKTSSKEFYYDVKFEVEALNN